MKSLKVRLDQKSKVSEQEVRMVAMVADLHSSQSQLRKKKACIVPRLYCTFLFQPVQEQNNLTQRWWRKGKITL